MAGKAKSRKPVKVAPIKPNAPLDVRDTAAEMMAYVQAAQKRVVQDPVMTEDEKAKTFGKLAETLTKIAKLTGDATDMPESKLLKVPALRRVLDEILTALAPWPEAIRACAEAIARLEA